MGQSNNNLNEKNPGNMKKNRRNGGKGGHTFHFNIGNDYSGSIGKNYGFGNTGTSTNNGPINFAG